jgi:hypothetical protein
MPDLIAPLLDITEALMRRRYPCDSRLRYRLFEGWARDFLVDFAARSAAGRRPEETWYRDIADFVLRKARACGFTA